MSREERRGRATAPGGGATGWTGRPVDRPGGVEPAAAAMTPAADRARADRFHERWLRRARAAGWAGRAWRRVRRELRHRRLADVVLPVPPPHGPARGRGSVRAVLRLVRASCLEDALVLQRWDAAGGRPRDVVVGVSRSGGCTSAHAWLDGDDPRGDFVEIHRLPAGRVDGPPAPVAR